MNLTFTRPERAGVPQRTTCVLFTPWKCAASLDSRLLPWFPARRCAGQHRHFHRASRGLVATVEIAVRDLVVPLSPIAGRGRCELKAGLVVTGGRLAQPRNRYKPGGELGRGEFAQVLR